ncbi:MAG: hypothetical protein ABIH46_04325 [Chloroflexota bacterium]
MPTATFCTEGFSSLGRAEASGMGVPSLPIVEIPKAIEYSTLPLDEIEEIARRTADEVIAALTQEPAKLAEKYRKTYSLTQVESRLSRPKASGDLDAVLAPDSVAEVTRLFYKKGWTDGLPIIPPDEEAVESMLEYCDRDRDEVIGKVPPRWGKATAEKIAINAVMAGCLPEYFPVVLTAVQALSDPKFNLFAVQATTNPVAPLAIVNGPIVNELGINYSFNAFGQGWQPNATIGRAIRLVMVNIGGGIPGTTDKAIHGQPAKFSFCVAENESESPWEPLHVERGFDRSVSAVSLAAVTGTLNFTAGGAGTPMAILTMAADSMAVRGANNVFYAGGPVLVLNPGHAAILAEAGYSKADVKRFIYDNARIPFSKVPQENRPDLMHRRPKLNFGSAHSLLPLTDSMDEIVVLVIGASGVHGMCLHSYGDPTPSITKPVLLKDGTPAKSVMDFKRPKSPKSK